MAHQFFFNSSILDNLPTPANGFDVVQDLAEPRLRLYITSRGAKTFFVRKRVRGCDKRIIIGSYPDTDIEEARNAVAIVLNDALRKIPVRRKKLSFKDFLTIYMKNHVRRCEDSEVKLLRAIDLHLSGLFDKTISDISQDDIKQVVRNIKGNTIAARMQELLASIFRYAIEQGYAKENPVQGLSKIVQTRRVSPLSENKVAQLLAAIKDLESEPMRNAFLMMIYSFLPKNKVLSMRWDELDFNLYLWRDWPLSDAAVVLLENMPQDGDWVFMGRCKNHLADPRVAWHRVVVAAGMPNLRMDDVHKFFMRQLVWASDREDVRMNMNSLLEKFDIH